MSPGARPRRSPHRPRPCPRRSRSSAASSRAATSVEDPKSARMTSTTLGPPRSAAAGWYVGHAATAAERKTCPWARRSPSRRRRPPRRRITQGQRTGARRGRAARSATADRPRSPRRWRPVRRGPALDDVGDEALGARESDLLFDELEQQPAASPDERLAALVLVATGRLADHHERRVERPGTDHDALTRSREHAARAGRTARLSPTHQSTRTRGTRAPIPRGSPTRWSRAVGPFVGRDLLVALAAEEHDLVAGRDGVVPDVDDQLVHRHHRRPGGSAWR